MKTFLSPQGRIGPATFRNAAILLIVIGALLSLLPLLSTALMALSFISLLLIYPWIVIWVKRFHDAGKSGWLFLVVFVLWLIVSMVAGAYISAQYAPALDMTGSTDFSAMMAAVGEQTRATLIPSTIASVIISLVFVLGGNALLKSDPAPNAYGPPVAQ